MVATVMRMARIEKACSLLKSSSRLTKARRVSMPNQMMAIYSDLILRPRDCTRI